MKITVYYSGKNVYSAEGLRFVPGINEVSYELWQKAQRNKLFVKRIEDGILKVQSIPNHSKGPTSADLIEEQSEESYSLSGLNTQQAGELISKTFDTDLLKSWEEQEERKGVLKLISERIDEIESSLSPKDEKDSDEQVNGDE